MTGSPNDPDSETDLSPEDPDAAGIERHLEVDESLAGQRLDKALAEHIEGLSRSRIKALIEGGAVRINGVLARDPSRKLGHQDTVTLLEPAPEPADPAPEPMDLTIAYEDDALIVIDKPAGLVVHPAPGHASGTLVNGLLAHCGASLSGIGGVLRPGIVHRIDKETSGLLVVAKSDAAHGGLSAQFAAHDLERSYLAFVRGAPRLPSGMVDKPIGRSPHDRKKMAIRRNGGRDAVTHYDRLARYPDTDPDKAVAALMRCRLETGRTHQIRVHMADLGHPVLGDPLYGKAKALLPRSVPESVKHFVETGGRQALHAATLGFTHPIKGEPLRFESALPADLEALKAALEAI